MSDMKMKNVLFAPRRCSVTVNHRGPAVQGGCISGSQMRREGPGTAKARRDEGAGRKARRSGVWETCVLESKLTQNKEKVFHSRCFPRNSPGAAEYSFHGPGTLPLQFTSTNQREESGQLLPFSLLGPHLLCYHSYNYKYLDL